MTQSLLQQARQLIRENQYEKAIYCLQELLVHDPDVASHYLEISSCLIALGKLDEAIVVVKQGMAHANQNFMGVCQQQLGNILLRQQRYELAAPLFEQLIAKNTLGLDAYLGLSNIYLQTHQPNKAIKVLKTAPHDIKSHNAYILNLTLAMFQIREVDSAIETILDYWKTQAVDKDLLSNAMMFASYTSKHDDFLNQITPHLNTFYEITSTKQLRKYAHDRLRVGFVSGDFRMHPVGYFLHSFLSELNKFLDIYIYSNNSYADHLTSQIRKCCAKFSLIDQLSTETAAQRIVNDEIDVLIDLSGHTAKNRLDIFHKRAAPYQLSYLGFPESTGLAQIDGQITDVAHIHEAEVSLYPEKIWYLPGSRFSFLPAINLPEIADFPMLSNHYITFGNVGNPCKISPSCANIWGQVLLAFPNARLKLKHQLWDDLLLKKSVLKIWTDMGVEPGRIEFYTSSQYDVYIEFFTEIDFILDSYPFSGGTTTCEALWMGVPVLTIPGFFPASRQGVSILQTLDEDQWVFKDVNQLIQFVKNINDNPYSMSDFKRNIRSKIKRSTVGNGSEFAQNFNKILSLIKCQLN